MGPERNDGDEDANRSHQEDPRGVFPLLLPGGITLQRFVAAGTALGQTGNRLETPGARGTEKIEESKPMGPHAESTTTALSYRAGRFKGMLERHREAPGWRESAALGVGKVHKPEGLAQFNLKGIPSL